MIIYQNLMLFRYKKCHPSQLNENKIFGKSSIISTHDWCLVRSFKQLEVNRSSSSSIYSSAFAQVNFTFMESIGTVILKRGLLIISHRFFTRVIAAIVSTALHFITILLTILWAYTFCP